MLTYFLYIDPGSGSYLVQMLVAGALGVLYFFKNIRLLVTGFFASLFRKKTGNKPSGLEQ